MDCEKNAPGYGNNVAYVINDNKKLYLKEQTEIVGN